MKEITIISGKGGTGKTSVTAALASLGENLVLCDADVDAADLHLILQPEILEEHVFEGAWVAEINQDACTSCGICFDHCRFNAINVAEVVYEIDPIACEGCRLCERVCPSGAISSEKSRNNRWYVSQTRAGIMTHAHMGPGEENSGKLVTQVRRKARDLAKNQKADFILVDGPPGTGCAAISSITGTDAILLVTEASSSGKHDAQRVIELARPFGIPVFGMINKADIHAGLASEIAALFREEKITHLGELDFDEDIVRAMVSGQSIVEFAPGSKSSHMLKKVWTELRSKA